MFINYDPNYTGITINPFRKPDAIEVGDVVGLVEYMMADKPCCCDLEGAIDALEDGAVWEGTDATEEVLEAIHNAIREHESSGY